MRKILIIMCLLTLVCGCTTKVKEQLPKKDEILEIEGVIE